MGRGIIMQVDNVDKDNKKIFLYISLLIIIFIFILLLEKQTAKCVLIFICSL